METADVRAVPMKATIRMFVKYITVAKIRQWAMQHCGNCEEVPCARLGKMSDFKDLNTNNVKVRTCTAIAAEGFDKWYEEYCECAELLTTALEKYNNGRMKRYLCELFIQKDMELLRSIMKQAERIPGDVSADRKERGKAFQALVKEQSS